MTGNKIIIFTDFIISINLFCIEIEQIVIRWAIPLYLRFVDMKIIFQVSQLNQFQTQAMKDFSHTCLHSRFIILVLQEFLRIFSCQSICVWTNVFKDMFLHIKPKNKHIFTIFSKISKCEWFINYLKYKGFPNHKMIFLVIVIEFQTTIKELHDPTIYLLCSNENVSWHMPNYFHRKLFNKILQ